jgi:hypothetical protein
MREGQPSIANGEGGWATAGFAETGEDATVVKLWSFTFFSVPGRSSNIKTPVAKPKAVTTGAANQIMVFKTMLSCPDFKTGMATAIQPI